MELGGVGLVMLVVVFIYYLRMVGRRMASRQRKDQISLILEKVGILESVAQDRKALLIVEQAQQSHPNQPRLAQAQARIQARLNSAES
ncbi:hypothetical protein [Reinekea forsetii]|jgi:hypothetical protein|uniref:Uncharacterized protein n=1 Tax=Reinekea forsetii TaxID=1336806 RepID=A0A2K8KRI7_9GAMM|nr:hypothetical protein [Reinekea forsetii]ATX75506.1 hypothetical protein REIFOR_00329 [Reinekea forsetii]